MPDWEELKHRLIAGDDSALGELERALDESFRGALGGPGGLDSRLEVLHEVLLTILRCRQQQRLAAIRNLKAYCATVLVAERARASNVGPNTEPLGPSAEGTTEAGSLLESLARAEMRAQVRGLLARLPPVQAEVLILADAADLNVPQIAAWFQSRGRPRSRSSVESLLKRARQAFRALLTPEFTDRG